MFDSVFAHLLPCLVFFIRHIYPDYLGIAQHLTEHSLRHPNTLKIYGASSWSSIHSRNPSTWPLEPRFSFADETLPIFFTPFPEYRS